MRRQGFYFRREDEDPQRSKGQVRVFERDGFICSHCGKAVFVPPMCDPASVAGRCTICSDSKDPLKGLVCAPCKKLGKCLPFEEQLARCEQREILFSDIGLGK